MKLLIPVRNAVIRFGYRYLLKPVFFRRDPEDVHDRMLHVGAVLGRFAFLRGLTRVMFGYSHPVLKQDVLGMHFRNPIGLAAGFDKDAVLTDILPSVGFGFEEVGSITGEPCEGNPRPRLWRLQESKSLVVYYGLKNEGAEKIAARLENKHFAFPVGISVAKTNCKATVATAAGIADYVKAFEEFVDIGSYFTINISCPNAYGGEPFTDPEKLSALLMALDEIPTKKPIFLKLSADLDEAQIDNILDVVKRHRVHGFVCTNLTKRRDNSRIVETDVPENGGLSGKVVEEMANVVIRSVYEKTRGKYVIIGCGGVFSAEDAYRKIRLGASLIQLITGMIFEGPQLISDINRGLVRLLKRDGFRNVRDAIGVDVLR